MALASGGLLSLAVAVPVAAALVVILERLQDRVIPVAQEAAAEPAFTSPEGDGD